jgi:hypothetical protein
MSQKDIMVATNPEYWERIQQQREQQKKQQQASSQNQSSPVVVAPPTHMDTEGYAASMARAQQQQEQPVVGGMKKWTTTPAPKPSQQAPSAPPTISSFGTELTVKPDPRYKDLSPTEQQYYGSYLIRVGEASAEYREQRRQELRRFGINPTEGTLYSVNIGGKRYSLGGKELKSWEQKQQNEFFDEILPKYRETMKPVAESRQFYETIGYPEYGGKYEPFEIPEGFKVSGIQKTGSGLDITFTSTTQQPLSKHEHDLLEMQLRMSPMFSFGRAVYESIRPDIQQKRALEAERVAAKSVSGVSVSDVKVVSYSPYRPGLKREPEVFGYSKEVVTPSYHPSMKREVEAFGVSRSDLGKLPMSVDVSARYSVEDKRAKGLAQQILEFEPFEFGQELGLNVFGVKDEQRRQQLKEQNIMKPVVDVAGKNLVIFDKPTAFLSGVVAPVENVIYIPFQLAGIQTPSVPQTFSGAVVAEAGAAFSGVGGGDTQRLLDEYGASYVAGSITGDVLLSFGAGKAVTWARGTKIGGKLLDPIFKPVDIAEKWVSKKIYEPIKGKVVSFKNAIIKPKPQLTGWERGGFGTKGYTLKEYRGVVGGESPFKSNLPSVIKDERAEIFMSQASRATSYPVKVTSSEQTVYGIGDKPYIQILKNPPNIIGGGRVVLVEPSLVTKTPMPMISSLKTKIAPQLMISVAPPKASKFFVSLFGGVGATTLRATAKQQLIFETTAPTVTTSLKHVPFHFYQPSKQKKETSPLFGVISGFDLSQIVTPQTILSTQTSPLSTTISAQIQAPITTPITITKFRNLEFPTQKSKDLMIPLVGQLQTPQMATLQIPTQIQITLPKLQVPQRQKTTQSPVFHYLPKNVGKKPFVPYVPFRTKKKGKSKTGLFGGWTLKEHPLPTVEQVNRNVIGVLSRKKGKKGNAKFVV